MLEIYVKAIDSWYYEESRNENDLSEIIKIYVPDEEYKKFKADYKKAVTYAKENYAEDLINKGFTEEEANEREDLDENGLDAFLRYIEKCGYKYDYVTPDLEFEW